MSTEDQLAKLGPWAQKFPEIVSFMAGGGTKLLNVVGPSFSGRSSSIPRLVNIASQGQAEIFGTYAVRTRLDAMRLSKDADIRWPELDMDVSEFSELLTYNRRYGLEAGSVVFIDVDPDASLAYVLFWAELALCARDDAASKRRIIAISETAIPEWQKNVFASLSMIGRGAISSMKAPSPDLLDIERYITRPSLTPQQLQELRGTEVASREALLAVHERVSMLKQQHDLMEDFMKAPKTSERRAMLFVGDSAELMKFIGLYEKDVRVLINEIDDTSSLSHVKDAVEAVHQVGHDQPIILCVDHGVRISLEEAEHCGFTHIVFGGRGGQRGVRFSRITGNFVNDTRADENYPEWELQRTLSFAAKKSIFPAFVFCMKTPLLSGVEAGATVVETRLFCQRNLYAFVLHCLGMADHFKINLANVVIAFSSLEEIEGHMWREMLGRLAVASLAHSVNNNAVPGPTDRARAVYKWLPELAQNVAAARIMAGVEVVHKDFNLRRILIAMAVILAHHDKPWLVISEDARSMRWKHMRTYSDGFFKGRRDICYPSEGFIWTALSAWTWAMEENLDTGIVPFAGGTMTVDAEKLYAMRVEAHSLASKVRLEPDQDTQKHALRAVTGVKRAVLQQELLCCSLDRLYWVTGSADCEWSIEGRGPSAKAVEVWDIVSKRAVADGVNCRMFSVSAIHPEGSFAVSTSPNELDNGSSLVVPNLTLIPTEVVRRWAYYHVSEDSEEPREEPLGIHENAVSSYVEEV